MPTVVIRYLVAFLDVRFRINNDLVLAFNADDLCIAIRLKERPLWLAKVKSNPP
jgi:hypothetical protein